VRRFLALSVAASAALALVVLSARPADAVTPAPGGPGGASSWTSGEKQGLGTSTTTASKIWYTLGDGTTTEVYYPTVDRPQVQDLQYVVTDGASFTDLERDATTHTTQLVDSLALEYRQIDLAKNGRYRITKTYVTDPDRATLLISTRFEQLAGTAPLALYALFNPSLDGTGAHDSGSTNGSTLIGNDGSSTSALSSSLPFTETSNGYSGTSSDALVQLAKDHALTTKYDTASSGNLVQVGRIPVSTDTTFTLALSFATDAAAALDAITASTTAGFTDRQSAYVSGWHDWLAGLAAAPASVTASPKLTTQYYVALMALRAHEDKTYRGASVASLSMPWGQARSGDGTDHGYRAVWARDLYEVATALQASGDIAGANRALDYLLTVQERADGSLPHNSLVDGSSTGLAGLQNDEIAYPAVLAVQLGRFDGATWAKVRLSAEYLLAHGPATAQERWEEQSGYSPSTVAAEIAGLVSAAAIAEHNGDTSSADRYRATADLWQSSVESWTVTRTGSLGTPHYERIDPVGQPDTGSTVCDTNGAGCADARVLVDGGFLELVRLGVKPATDALIAQSVGLVDATLKVTTPAGPMWHRYNKDGYGEHADGSAFDGTPGGIGRPWPVLAGERGEYELALGHDARPYLVAMADAANRGHLIPEQVWDTADTGHFRAGQPTDSAAPLAWAMAQYVRLAQSITAGHNLDTPTIVSARYSADVTATFTETATTSWGQNIYLVGDVPALGGWGTAKAIRLSSAGYPNWVQRISLPAGAAIQYKFINKAADGSVIWESGINRTATLPASGDVSYSSAWK
jgi:glucoamylase